MSLSEKDLRRLAAEIRGDVTGDDAFVAYRAMVAQRDEAEDCLKYARNVIPDEFRRPDGDVEKSVAEMVARIHQLETRLAYADSQDGPSKSTRRSGGIR